jgi:DNA mismatch endonuclease (patch repair protein)
MADIFTKRKRSAVMSAIRSRGNAATELRLITVFRAHGITGWRRGASLQWKGEGLKLKKFRVRPDFVFRPRKLAVFVDGCFWHGCPLHATSPKTNAAFWRNKIAANRTRDRLVTRTLRARGWTVLRIWGHELNPAHTRRLLTRLRRAGLEARLALQG